MSTLSQTPNPATVLSHLRSLNHHAFLAYTIDIGTYVVNQYFDGDFAATHDQDSHKSHSFNAFLQAHADELAELDLGGRTLRKYMAAAEVWAGLPESTREQLGFSHLQHLAALPDPAERKQLAHDAATLNWTKDQVAKAVQHAKKAKRAGKKKPGRKPKAGALKAASAVRASVRRLKEFSQSVAKLGEAERKVLRADLEHAIAALNALLARAAE